VEGHIEGSPYLLPPKGEEEILEAHPMLSLLRVERKYWKLLSLLKRGRMPITLSLWERARVRGKKSEEQIISLRN